MTIVFLIFCFLSSLKLNVTKEKLQLIPLVVAHDNTLIKRYSVFKGVMSDELYSTKNNGTSPLQKETLTGNFIITEK